jgi:putative transposase
MPRSLRLQFPGAHYHVMARGNHREAIFLDDDDRRFFLQTLAQACAMTGWRVHAWVLMGNHYHLFLETPEPNLVAGMQWLQNTYTRRHNVRHRKWGRLFGERYKAVPVEAGVGSYYQTLMDYIHLNPVRARIVQPKRGQSVLDYPWSSVAAGYAKPPRQRAKWLAVEAGLKAFGWQDTTESRRRMVERLDRRAVLEAAAACGVPELAPEVDARCSHLRRGWYWGTQKFGEKMLKLARTGLSRVKARDFRSTAVHKTHGQKQAEDWLQEGLQLLGLDQRALQSLKGSDARKVALARLLWDHTTVSQSWISQRLHMRSAANVSQLLSRSTPKPRRPPLPPRFSKWLHSVKI